MSDLETQIGLINDYANWLYQQEFRPEVVRWIEQIEPGRFYWIHREVLGQGHTELWLCASEAFRNGNGDWAAAFIHNAENGRQFRLIELGVETGHLKSEQANVWLETSERTISPKMLKTLKFNAHWRD